MILFILQNLGAGVVPPDPVIPAANGMGGGTGGWGNGKWQKKLKKGTLEAAIRAALEGDPPEAVAEVVEKIVEAVPSPRVEITALPKQQDYRSEDAHLDALSEAIARVTTEIARITTNARIAEDARIAEERRIRIKRTAEVAAKVRKILRIIEIAEEA